MRFWPPCLPHEEAAKMRFRRQSDRGMIGTALFLMMLSAAFSFYAFVML